MKLNDLPTPALHAVRAAPRAPECRKPRLEAAWARHEDDLRAAQRLRWRVFVEEMGATLRPPRGTPPGHDADLFDPYCEHLLVRTAADDEPSRVVGTYRVLTPAAARRVGGLYSGEEFDLSILAPLRPTLAELGRSCVDPDFRHGGVILMLWGALAGFMQRNDLRRMIGCASVPMRDGGHYAASLWRRLEATHLAPIEWRVRARCPLPVDGLDGGRPVEPTPLLKGYLNCGAKVLGAPAWDPALNTADLPLMLDLADLPPSHRRRFLG
jgi:putative hemolysin